MHHLGSEHDQSGSVDVRAAHCLATGALLLLTCGGRWALGLWLVPALSAHSKDAAELLVGDVVKPLHLSGPVLLELHIVESAAAHNHLLGCWVVPETPELLLGPFIHDPKLVDKG